MTDPKLIAELKRIAQKHGGMLRPADVLNEAQNPQSILHDKFDWDDSEAAHKYRLMQARQLIRVTVSYVGSSDKNYRVFVSLTPDRMEDGGGYREVEAVLRNQSYRAQLLQDAIFEMKRFRAKYGELEELAAVFDAMNAATQEAAPARGRNMGRPAAQPTLQPSA